MGKHARQSHAAARAKVSLGALDNVPNDEELVEAEDPPPAFGTAAYKESRRLHREFFQDPRYTELADRLEQQAYQKFEALVLPSARVWNRALGLPPPMSIDIGAHEVHHFAELMRRARDYAVIKSAQSEFADRFHAAMEAYTAAKRDRKRREVAEGLAFKAFFQVEWRAHTSRDYNPRIVLWLYDQLRGRGPVPLGCEGLTWRSLRRLPDAPKRLPNGCADTDVIRTPLPVGWAHAAIAVVCRFSSIDAVRKYIKAHPK